MSRFSVSRNDCLFAGNRGRYFVGPLEEMDDAPTLRERLGRIAAGGPLNRVGLFPDPTSRHWRFDAKAGTDWVTIADHPALDGSDPGRTVTDFVVDPKSQTPMHLYLARRWLLIDFDHGLGGGKFITELIAAMTSDAPAFAEPQPLTDCRAPLLRALTHSARTQPRKLIQSVDLDRGPNPPSCSGPFEETTDVVFVRSDPEFLRQVRALRDRDNPGASVLAMLTSAMLRALNAVGIETDPAVGVMVDLGRFLPKGTGTLSNFVGVAPISVSPPFGARVIGDQIERYTTGYRSLSRYSLATLAGMVRPTAQAVTQHCKDHRARLVVTDHGETPAARKIRWAQPETERVYLRHAPIGYSNQVTLATNRVGNQLHLSATFYATTFSRASIDAALQRVACGVDIGNC